MKKFEHIARHRELHRSLDELVADFINHTKKSLRKASVTELMEWTAGQREKPDE